MAQDLLHLTISQCHDLLRQRRISALELTQAHLQAIHRMEPHVRAFINLSPELALAQAREADVRLAAGEGGLLTGVPMQLKDVLATRGVPTTCGSRMLEGFTPPYDAAVAELLYRQGAVLLGKGNMDEFAMGSSTENSAFHPTRNPWDLGRVPGGSSGGPAAAVASGECVYSLGSDTGGSVRQPAAMCGLVGLKPTYGLVSRWGLVAYASSLDQVGPLARDVSDCALLLNAIAGHDARDSTSIPGGRPDYHRGLAEGVRGLRVGVPREYFSEGLDTEVQRTVERALGDLADLGAEVEEVSLPSTPHALAAYYVIAPAECSANLARYDGVKYGLSVEEAEEGSDAMASTRRLGFGPEVKRRIMLGAYALSAGYYDAFYLKALKVRTLLQREFQEAFQRFDVLASPTSPTVAFPLGERTADPVRMYLSDVCTVPANIAGIPAMSVPCGFAHGLPVGLQLMGPALSEAVLLRTAWAYEQANQWRTMRPPLWASFGAEAEA